MQVAVNSSYPDLVRHDYDIAFVTTTDLLPDSSLAGKRVLRVERGFYAAPSFIERMGRRVATPAELVSLPVIGDQDEKLWEFNTESAKETALAVNPRLRTENAEIRKKAVLQGLGVARFSFAFVHDEVKSGALSLVLPEYVSSPVKVYALMPTLRLPTNIWSIASVNQRAILLTLLRVHSTTTRDGERRRQRQWGHGVENQCVAG